MTNKDILEKAIQKAIDGGWKQDLFFLGLENWDFDERELRWEQDREVGFEHISVYQIIFNQDFAKALWGEEMYHHVFIVPKELSKRFAGTHEWDIKPEWQYHLQQMVISPDPIKYLSENMPVDNPL